VVAFAVDPLYGSLRAALPIDSKLGLREQLYGWRMENDRAWEQARFYAGARGPRPLQLLLRPPVSFNALSRWNWIARNRVGSGDQAPQNFWARTAPAWEVGSN
jgi:hypothetical protein